MQRALFLSLSLSLLTLGCNQNLITPPTHLSLLETAPVLKAGEVEISGQGGRSAAVFGPEMISGALGARQGFGHQGEVRLELLYMELVSSGTSDASRTMIAGDLSTKWDTGKLWFMDTALLGGVGFGDFAGGPVLGQHLGGILSVESRWGTALFLKGEALLNVPLSPKEVDVSIEDNPHHDAPTISYGARGALGLQQAVALESRRLLFNLALQLDHMGDRDGEEGFLSVMGGAAYRF